MSNQNMSSNQYRKLAETSVSAAPMAMEEVKVELSSSALVLEAYIEELYANLESAVAAKGGSLSFSNADLFTYALMLVKTRVDYTNGLKVDFRPTDLLVIPSYLSVVLESVGVVTHFDLGLVLQPHFEAIKTDKAFMMKISRSLAILGNVGFEYAKGYSRSKEGSFDFMSMTLLEGQVRSFQKDAHPVNALLSATLGTRGIEAVLSPRITYGAESHFRALVRHCAALKQ